jgi:hypothetical protein
VREFHQSQDGSLDSDRIVADCLWRYRNVRRIDNSSFGWSENRPSKLCTNPALQIQVGRKRYNVMAVKNFV